MKKLLHLMVIALCITGIKATAQAVSPFTTCPDVSVALARAGTNNDVTNPFFLYSVNQSTGAMTLAPGGPFKDPADPNRNLQLNAAGVNKKDGYIYALSNDGSSMVTSFVRLDKNYGVTSFGVLPPPTSPGMIGVINYAAGEVDTAGNYYFTAVTATPATFTFDKFFIGKIENTHSLVGTPTVTYYEVDVTSATCLNYITTLISDPDDSGLKDISFNARRSSFYAYATYKPTGAANYSAQIVEIKPIQGSNPLRYQILCNTVVNTHNTETAGSIIDKFGKMTILFTDGSFGMANRTLEGNYDGTYTPISNATGLSNPLRGDMAGCGQQVFPGPPIVPVTNCPDANIAVLREGFNLDTLNQTHIYTINTTNGSVTKLGDSYLAYPDNPSRPLHVNAVGINKTDGFFYGLANDFTAGAAKFVRFDQKYGVHIIGNVTPPTSPTGTIGLINTAAGDMDRLNNYYFTALTVTINPLNGAVSMDKAFIGKISNVSTLDAPVVPQYFEIDMTDANCADFITSINTDPINSGLKDIIFSPFTETFYSYATYKPAGNPGYVGRMIQFRPVQGSNPLRYALTCDAVVNNHTAETSGALIDKLGNFIVMLTDGTIGRIQSTGSILNYNGIYGPLNNNTGLPSVIRGDVASCSEAEGAVPVTLLSFNARERDCRSVFSWSAENEVNFRSYELLQSFDNITFNLIGTVPAKKGNTKNNYSLSLGSAGKTAFYRLKMTDEDGKTYYSSIVSINNSCKPAMSFMINPNPVKNQLNLNWYGVENPTVARIRIYDVYGKELRRLNANVSAGNSITTINVDDLPAGTYFIKSADKLGTRMNQSFIKQ